jgi:hypothetical protein
MGRICAFTLSWIVAETVDAVVAHGGKSFSRSGQMRPRSLLGFVIRLAMCLDQQS